VNPAAAPWARRFCPLAIFADPFMLDIYAAVAEQGMQDQRAYRCGKFEMAGGSKLSLPLFILSVLKLSRSAPLLRCRKA
jgi:hypothetical protein